MSQISPTDDKVNRDDYARLIEPLARRFWGEPTKIGGDELRWGKHGSKSVKPKNGTWYDHEHNCGGGVLDLIVHEGHARDKGAAHKWLQANGLLPADRPRPRPRVVPREEEEPAVVVDKYDYVDEHGKLLYQVRRYEPKTFRPFRPLGSGKYNRWAADMDGVRRVPYRLPQLIKAVKANSTVFIPEGEKDVKALTELSLDATCNSGGAGKWDSGFSKYLKHADVVLLPDNDDAGRNHVRAIGESLKGIADSVRVLDLAKHWPANLSKPLEEGADVADWLDADGDKDDLAALAETAPTFEQWLGTVDTVDTVAPGGGHIDADAVIAEMANLADFDYEVKRRDVAKQLDIRTTALDKQRDALLASLKKSAEPSEEAWPDPVDGDELLNDLCDMFVRHVWLPKYGAEALALWTLHAHAHDAARHSPTLVINSPDSDCGKTTTLKALARVVPRRELLSSISTAAIYRVIAHQRPTLMIDEIDHVLPNNEALRGILDSCHDRETAYVWRCDGDDNKETKFSTWAPVVTAGLKLKQKMSSTLLSRSTMLSLERKPAHVEVEELPMDIDCYVDLRRRCARFVADNIEELRVAAPDLRDISNRARDNWRPLVAIADIAGGDWPELSRKIAAQLSCETSNQSYGTMLLADLRDLFLGQGHFGGERPADELSSSSIVEELTMMDDRPWPEYSHGKPLTKNQLARELRAYRIEPHILRSAKDKRVRGYSVGDFKRAFEHYLPPLPAGATVPTVPTVP